MLQVSFFLLKHKKQPRKRGQGVSFLTFFFCFFFGGVELCTCVWNCWNAVFVQCFCNSTFRFSLFFKELICLLDFCLIKTFLCWINPPDLILLTLYWKKVLPLLFPLKDFIDSCYAFKTITLHFTNCLFKMHLHLFENSALWMYVITIQWVVIHFHVAVVFWRRLEGCF